MGETTSLLEKILAFRRSHGAAVFEALITLESNSFICAFRTGNMAQYFQNGQGLDLSNYGSALKSLYIVNGLKGFLAGV